MTNEREEPEIIITRSSSKDAGTGWTIRLLREPEETDEAYTARVLAKHRELERELT